MKIFLLCVAITFNYSNAIADELTHCNKSENIVFSCVAGKKIISICAKPVSGAEELIEYRYGGEGKLEMTYGAENKNKNKFYASSQPVNPKAQVNELWFDKGDFRYLTFSCRGGDCKVAAGLIVYKNDEMISKKICEYNPSGHNAINLKGVDFDASVSTNPSVEFKEEYPDLTTVFPVREGRY
ncbi:hypothetical protein [Janthinobacterium sp.]|uniref:hypothetical protein n=1 Tax=Janthinobacterium sp. TaxID=1871054 RepID=UPI00293D99BE|nr:hypothetical protein [Janthinobacterium sp.]